MKNKKKSSAAILPAPVSRLESVFLSVLAISQIVLYLFFQKTFPVQTAWNNTMDFFFKLELPNATMWGFAFTRTALLILVCAVAFFIGLLVLSFFKGWDWNPLEVLTVSTLLGFCVLGLVIFGMGFLHLYKPDIFWFGSFAVVLGGLIWTATKGGKERVLKNVKFVTDRLSNLSYKPILILVLFFAYLMTLVPEIFYDSLVYHIGLPHLYLLEGGFVDTPNVQLSRFPLLIQSLYLYALPLGGDALAKMVHFAFLLLGALTIVLLMDRLKISSAAGLAILLMISIPVVQINVWTTAVDVAMGVIALMAFALTILWSKKEENSWALLCLAGIFTGSVFGTKYTGVLFIFAINAFLIFTMLQKKWSFLKMFQILFVFNAVAFVTLLPWLIRNMVVAHNPLYPFLGSIFPNDNLVPEKIAAQSAVSKGATPTTWWGWLLLPWSLSVTGYGGSFDFLGPAVVAFLPAVYFFRERKDLGAWGVFFLVYFLIGGFLSRHARYLLPGIMLLAVFAGAGLGSMLEDVRSGFWKWVFRINAVIMILTLFFWSVSVSATCYGPENVLSGKETREAYSSYYHPGMNPFPPNNLFDDIRNLPSNAKLMFIGEEKVFGTPRPFVYSNVYDKTPFVEMANSSQNVDELLGKLQSIGITHIMINIAEAARFKGYNMFPWHADKKTLVHSFFQEKTTLLTVRESVGQNALVLLAVDGNPQHQPTWNILAPGIEVPLELQIQ